MVLTQMKQLAEQTTDPQLFIYLKRSPVAFDGIRVAAMFLSWAFLQFLFSLHRLILELELAYPLAILLELMPVNLLVHDVELISGLGDVVLDAISFSIVPSVSRMLKTFFGTFGLKGPSFIACLDFFGKFFGLKFFL